MNINSTDRTRVQKAITDRYLNGREFNGTTILSLGANDREFRKLLAAMITHGDIFLNFGDRHPNPHVNALGPDDVEVQLAKLSATDDLAQVCAYPSAGHLRTRVEDTAYVGEPYTRALATGAGQLDCRFFDLSVLERYRNDPRYHYQTDGIQGWISVLDEHYQATDMRESDKVLLQQFGFGYDKDVTTRVVAVLVWDLSRLSPEHQQIWAAHEMHGSFFPHPGFWASVCGHWSDHISVFRAFVVELQIINAMTSAMGRPPLFRDDFRTTPVPREFAFVIRPTARELNAFVHELDKMLSDNISTTFFDGDIPRERHEERDGKIYATQKGTIALLTEWLEKHVTFPDPTEKDAMLATLREVRKLRNKPAHRPNDDVFDQKYFREQRDLMVRAYRAIRTLRLMFANDPATRTCDIPEDLREGRIWTQ